MTLDFKRKTILLSSLFFACFFLFSCGGDDEPGEDKIVIVDKQRTMIAYFGATWCPPCGENGGPLLDYIDGKYSKSDAVVLAFQVSDRISPIGTAPSDYAAELIELQQTTGIPRVWVQGAGVSEVQGLAATDSYNQDFIDRNSDNVLARATSVALNGTATLVEGSIVVSTELEFTDAVAGEYHIATYLLEDGIVADQKVGSTSNPETEEDVVHHHVVRGNFDTTRSVFGESLGSGFSIGDRLSKTHTITIPTINGSVSQVNTDNAKVAIVIWDKAGIQMENGIIVDLN